jgi:uncharacterized LabA/DUF88 family protein
MDTGQLDRPPLESDTLGFPPYFEKVALFIDLGNLYFAARKLNIRVDYTRMVEVLTKGRRLLRSFAYAGVDPHSPESQGYLTWMKRHGFRVVTKHLRRFPDGTVKANLDVELAIDMLMIAQHIDTAVLVSGDGDFVRLVEAVQFKGVRVEVVGLAEMTAMALIDVADTFTELSELVPTIQMPVPPNGTRENGSGHAESATLSHAGASAYADISTPTNGGDVAHDTRATQDLPRPDFQGK